jgi:hypothetical protein
MIPRRRMIWGLVRGPHRNLLIFSLDLERAMGFEPTTPTLARLWFQEIPAEHSRHRAAKQRNPGFSSTITLWV